MHRLICDKGDQGQGYCIPDKSVTARIQFIETHNKERRIAKGRATVTLLDASINWKGFGRLVAKDIQINRVLISGRSLGVWFRTNLPE